MAWRAAAIVVLSVTACSPPGTPNPSLDGPPIITDAQPEIAVVGVPFDLKLRGERVETPFAVTATRTSDLLGKPVSGPVVTGTATLFAPNLAKVGLNLPETGVYSLSIADFQSYPDAIIVYPESTAALRSNVFCSSSSKALAFHGTFGQAFGYPLILAVHAPDGPLQIVPLHEETGCTPVPNSRGIAAAVCTDMVAHLDHFSFRPPGQRLTIFVFPGPDAESVVDVLGESSPNDLSGFPSPIEIAVGDQDVVVPLPFSGSPMAVTPEGGPSLALDGVAIPTTPGKCAESGIPGKQLCAELTGVLPAGTAPGRHTIAISTISGCSASAPLIVHPPPRIDAIGPQPICIGNGTASIAGVGLFNGSVFVDGAIGPGLANCPDGTCGFLELGSLALGTHRAFVRANLYLPADSNEISFQTFPGPMQLGRPRPEMFAAGSQRPSVIPVSGETGASHQAFLVDAHDGGTYAAAVADTDGGVILTTPLDAPPGFYSFMVQDDSPCPGRPQFGSIDIEASPILNAYDFADGGQGVFLAGFPVQQAVQWDADAGVLSAVASGGYFDVPTFAFNADLGWVRFDLSACPFGAGALEPASLQLAGNGFTLDHPLDAPPCGWQHYDIALVPEGWTFTTASGSRPASASDFAKIIDSVHIPALFWSTGNEVKLDNVSVELAH